jgi:adhesin transport system outer membrane protein
VQSNDVRNHQAQQRAALKSVEAAKWQFFPTPSVAVEGVNASKDDPSYQGDAQVSYLRLQQPLWTGGRLTSNQDKARVNLELAQANTADTQLQLALRVVQAYADWATADLKVKAFQSSVDTHQQLLVQARNRIAEGVSPASDLNLVQGRADATAAEQSVAELQRLTRQNEALERQVDAPHPPIRHQPASMVVSHAISANKPSRPQKSTINLPPRWALSNVDSTDHQKTQTNLKVVVNIEFFKFVG